MSTPPTPLQVNFSTGLLQEMIASDEVIVSVEDGLQVAPFRNPWNNNAIEALVIIDATNGSGSLMHLAQDQTVATGWSLTPIVDSNGETVQAAGVVCCADTWWGVDAFYTAPGQQQIFHIWMTESGTDWTTASQLILTVEGEGEEITNLSIVYSPGASNASGVTMLAAEWSSQHVVNAFVYAGIDGWWHSAAFAAGGTCVGDWNSPVVIQDYNQDSGTWSGTLVVPSGTPLGNFTYCDAFCQIEFDGNQIQATPMAGSWLVDSTAIAGTIALSGNQDTFSGMVVTTDELVQNQTWLRPLSNSNSYSYNFGALSPVAWDGNLQHIAMLASSTGSIYLYLIDGNQVLWVLNSTSDVLPQWSPAIALDTPIMQIYADQMPWDSPALFAVDPGGVLHLHYQDPNTGFWATGPVKLSTTNQYDVTRWRTVASVYDANGNPVPNYPVTVAADSACDIAVGAEYYFIDSQTTMQVSTDAQGRTTFATVATSLSAPTLTLTVGETTSSSSPSIAVNDYFAGTGFLPGMPPFSGSVLASAQNAAGNGPLAPGLSDNGGSGPSGDQMAQYMAETAQMPTGGTTSARSGGERFVVLHKDPAGQRSVAELSSRDEVDAYLTRLGVPVGGATDSAWGDIANWAGDVWRGIKNAVIEVTTITFDFGENVLSITMDGIDDVLQWVVNTVEDALNAMHALFNWIDTKFDDLINWLKAVFNLGHIWDTKVAFTTLMGDVQTTLNDMLGWAQDWVYRLSGVRGFVTAGLNKAVSSYGQQTIGGIPNMNQATSPPSTTPFPGQSNGAQVSPSTVSTHPQATWFQDQVAANPPEGFQPSSPAQEWQDLLNSIDNAADGFADAVRSLGSALADAYNDAGGDLRQVTLADFVAGWKQSSCEVFLEQFGEDLLTALIQAGEVIVSSTFDALSQPLPDGLVSTLYGWVASAAGASSSSPPS